MSLFLFSCNYGNEETMSNRGGEILGYELKDDSVYFILKESEIMNFIDLKNTDFFETAHAPNFHEDSSYFHKAKDIKIKKVHVLGAFNEYSLTDELIFNGNYWVIPKAKNHIQPVGGDFLFIINERYAVTLPFFFGKNIHTPRFTNPHNWDFSLLRMYLVWQLYILDSEYEMAYQLKDDSIQFIFDPNIYALVNDGYGIQENYHPDMIDYVEVAGSFNAWSQYFKMNKVGDKYYKSLALKDVNTWGEFKFIINGRVWVNPPFYASNKLGHFTGTREYNFTYKNPNIDNIQGYTIQGNEIVFSWHLNDSDLLTFWERTYSNRFEIKNMYLYASFLETPGQKVLMEDLGDRHYEIRFPLSEIPKNKQIQFNYHANGMLLLTPPYYTSNVVQTDIWDDNQWVNFEFSL
ncbi:hypothetical protein [Flammeovirga sp. SubArs3]|uniref:hypothetical protein n=1 Tax=Flammeovirga sp. SubArs3 TaxID=2995316 RepID=UPI00248C2153|nr:hypothetical protein [Flammeovirga sp. SubArs3]